MWVLASLGVFIFVLLVFLAAIILSPLWYKP
jgi:hypothetical protein